MKALITGASGFIGGAIARHAVERGWEVTAPGRGALDALAPKPGDFDCVIHAAAVRHRHGIAAGDYARVNGALTERMLEVARAAKARFVFCSSVAVYGKSPRLPMDEFTPYAPEGPYGESKVACEALVAKSGLPYVIVQPTITYGPGDTNGMIDKMLRMIARHRFVVPGLGRSRIQLLYVEDAARLFLDAVRLARPEGERFICTYKEPVTISRMVSLLSRTVGGRILPVGPPVAALRLGARVFEAAERVGLIQGEPPLTREKLQTVTLDKCYRIDRMRAVLGSEPEVGYEEGFLRTAQAMGLA